MGSPDDETDVAITNADGQDVPIKEGLGPGLRAYPKIVLYCVALTSCILLYGYDLAIVGNLVSVPSFQLGFGQLFGKMYIIPSLWLALWNFASPVGSMLGAALGSVVQGRWGRRISLATGGLVSAIAVAVMFVSDSPDWATMMGARRGIFLASKIIQGIGIGMVICTTQTYMSEILPTRLRGPILAFFPIFTLIGQLVGAVVIFITLRRPGSSAYKIPIATQWPFSVAPLIVAIFLPESPAWLVTKDRVEKAIRSQERLRPRSDPHVLIEELRQDIEKERAQARQNGKRSYVDCFRGKDAKRTWIVVLANCLPQLWGLSLLSKASYFMQIVGMNANNSIIFLILGIVLGVCANIASMWTLNRLRRRFLIQSSLGVATILWLGMGISGFWSGSPSIWYTAITMMFVVMVCGIGVWPAGFVVASETSSLELRGATQGVGWVAQGLATAVTTLILPYIYNPDAGNLRGKTGFFFAGLCAVAFGLCWLLIPEMKDRKQAAIDEMFTRGVTVRAFEKFVCECEKIPLHEARSV